MILQALVSYYETLAANGTIARPGWSSVKVSYAIEIDDYGEVIGILSLKEEENKGKKIVYVPQEMILPMPVKRSVGVVSNFLCDNSSYILSIDNKGKPERTKECFETCKALHEKLLCDVDDPAAKSLLMFFEKWNPDKLSGIITDEAEYEDILNNSNLVFMYDMQYLHDNQAIKEAWENYYSSDEGEQFPCLITGKMAPAARLHPNIKGIPGAQSSGASLVSFNAPAFCSYGREQGMNAPTSEYAAFAYGAALNYLISTQNTRIGDTTVLFWAEKGQEVYRDVMNCWGFGIVPDNYSEEDLRNLLEKLPKGQAVDFDGERLDPDMNFYILGIAPNAARLSVRFFLRNTFGYFMKNIQEHFSRLEIVKPSYDSFDTIPLWILLKETVNPHSKDKTPVPGMSAETLKSILVDGRYPATLLNGIEMRIRADRVVNRNRAAIIKAYYLKNKNINVPEEVLTVSLNQDSTNVAYVLGRLFAVLEYIQDTANPGINTTIRDKYFSSASATPASVFPTLINLSQKHLKKMDTKNKVFFEKQLNAIFEKLEDSYPSHLNLPQQGSFQLGYYHQNAYRYTKKEDK